MIPEEYREIALMIVGMLAVAMIVLVHHFNKPVQRPRPTFATIEVGQAIGFCKEREKSYQHWIDFFKNNPDKDGKICQCQTIYSTSEATAQLRCNQLVIDMLTNYIQLLQEQAGDPPSS